MSYNQRHSHSPAVMGREKSSNGKSSDVFSAFCPERLPDHRSPFRGEETLHHDQQADDASGTTSHFNFTREDFVELELPGNLA